MSSHKERDVVFLDHAGKLRPAVVMLVHPDSRAYVIYGTRTERPGGLLVSPESREGRALQLQQPTYFYKGNAVVSVPSALRPRSGSCPPGLFLKLRHLLDMK